MSAALLDHHGDPLTERATGTVRSGSAVLGFEGPRGVAESVHVRATDARGRDHDWVLPWMLDSVQRGTREALEEEQDNGEYDE